LEETLKEENANLMVSSAKCFFEFWFF